MGAMNRSSRLSNVFFTFLGAAAVGLVIAVLAVAGVFDPGERVVREVPRATATPTTAVADSPSAGRQRLRHLRPGLARRRLHPVPATRRGPARAS